MIHEVFGQIQYDYLWSKTFEIRIFGQKEVGVLNISGEEDEEIAQNQIDAFTEFELHKSRLIESTETALFDYYQSVIDEYRDRYGNAADEYAPYINDVEDMKSLLKFEAINLPYSFIDNQRVVGILFKAKWEVEHGVAVKIFNGKIVDVGFQEIVL